MILCTSILRKGTLTRCSPLKDSYSTAMLSVQTCVTKLHIVRPVGYGAIFISKCLCVCVSHSHCNISPLLVRTL